MTKTMAEVLAEHQDWTYQKNLGYYRSEYLCGCGETFWSGDHEEDPSFNQATAAHQAAALSAAGFGLVADAGAKALDDAADAIDAHRPEMGLGINITQYREGRNDAFAKAADTCRARAAAVRGEDAHG